MIADDQITLEHFQTHGWMRVSAAFTADEAEAMRDAVWHALEGVGIRRDRPSTWTTERPVHLQRLKKDPYSRQSKANEYVPQSSPCSKAKLGQNRKMSALSF